jgi:hypothetical protein
MKAVLDLPSEIKMAKETKRGEKSGRIERELT